MCSELCLVNSLKWNALSLLPIDACTCGILGSAVGSFAVAADSGDDILFGNDPNNSTGQSEYVVPDVLIPLRDLLEKRIIGGTETAPNRYPWVTLVLGNDGSSGTGACGGSIISPRHILTGENPLSNVKLGFLNIHVLMLLMRPRLI